MIIHAHQDLTLNKQAVLGKPNQMPSQRDTNAGAWGNADDDTTDKYCRQQPPAATIMPAKVTELSYAANAHGVAQVKIKEAPPVTNTVMAGFVQEDQLI
jgi:hypothetical protein